MSSSILVSKIYLIFLDLKTSIIYARKKDREKIERDRERKSERERERERERIFLLQFLVKFLGRRNKA